MIEQNVRVRVVVTCAEGMGGRGEEGGREGGKDAGRDMCEDDDIIDELWAMIASLLSDVCCRPPVRAFDWSQHVHVSVHQYVTLALR